MSDFVRSARKTELNQKSLEWSQSKLDQYYEGFASPNATKIAFERTTTGYIAASPNRINLVQITTGDRYVYQTIQNSTWDAYSELFNTFSSENVKLETPLYRDINTDTNKEYLEIRTPNKEIGFSMGGRMGNDNPNSDVYEQYLLNWIDAVAEILPVVKSIAVKYNIGVPRSLFHPGNFVKDSSNVNYFSNMETNWNVATQSEFSQIMSVWLQKAKTRYSHKLSLGNIEALEQRARSTWT